MGPKPKNKAAKCVKPNNASLQGKIKLPAKKNTLLTSTQLRAAWKRYYADVEKAQAEAANAQSTSTSSTAATRNTDKKTPGEVTAEADVDKTTVMATENVAEGSGDESIDESFETLVESATAETDPSDTLAIKPAGEDNMVIEKTPINERVKVNKKVNDKTASVKTVERTAKGSKAHTIMQAKKARAEAAKQAKTEAAKKRKEKAEAAKQARAVKAAEKAEAAKQARAVKAAEKAEAAKQARAEATQPAKEKAAEKAEAAADNARLSSKPRSASDGVEGSAVKCTKRASDAPFAANTTSVKERRLTVDICGSRVEAEQQSKEVVSTIHIEHIAEMTVDVLHDGTRVLRYGQGDVIMDVPDEAEEKAQNAASFQFGLYDESKTEAKRDEVLYTVFLKYCNVLLDYFEADQPRPFEYSKSITTSMRKCATMHDLIDRQPQPIYTVASMAAQYMEDIFEEKMGDYVGVADSAEKRRLKMVQSVMHTLYKRITLMRCVHKNKAKKGASEDKQLARRDDSSSQDDLDDDMPSTSRSK